MLIIRYLHGELDEDGKKELQDWTDQSEANRRAVEDFLNNEKLKKGVRSIYETREKVWGRLNSQIPDGKPKKAPVISILKYVAAAAIIISIFAGLYYFYFSNHTRTSTVAKADNSIQQVRKDIPPGTDRATLTLADGSKVVMDTAGTGVLTKEGNTRLIKTSDGNLVYKADGDIALTNLYNTISTPRGGQFQLTLPDGTKVWMNAASSLRYPVVFTGNERNVELSGEAYFEVAHNAARPFRVTINSGLAERKGASIEVLGTHFNVNAYDDEPAIKTTLLEGKVKMKAANNVKSAMLVPGEQAQLNNTGDLKIIAKADTEEALAWKNGMLQLTSADMQTIMRQIARWYNVEVKYESTIPAGHISGKVPRSLSLQQTLHALEMSGMHFRLEENVSKGQLATVIVLP